MIFGDSPFAERLDVRVLFRGPGHSPATPDIISLPHGCSDSLIWCGWRFKLNSASRSETGSRTKYERSLSPNDGSARKDLEACIPWHLSQLPEATRVHSTPWASSPTPGRMLSSRNKRVGQFRFELFVHLHPMYPWLPGPRTQFFDA